MWNWDNYHNWQADMKYCVLYSRKTILWPDTPLPRALAGDSSSSKPITKRCNGLVPLHETQGSREQRSSFHFVWFKHFNHKLKAIRIYAFNLSMDNDIYMLHVPNILECRMLKVRMTRNTFKVHCYNKTTDFPQPPLLLKYLAYQVKRRLLCPLKFGYPL